MELDKDNQNFITQQKRLVLFLTQYTASRWMAARATDIPLQNVCLYVKDLIKNGKLAIIKKDRCCVSKRRVQYLSANPDLFPRDNQLKLWE